MTKSFVGKSIKRSDGLDKISGNQKYLDDLKFGGLLYASILSSPHAHAEILNIDIKEAEKSPGVKKVITGDYHPHAMGLYLGDKPPLAVQKVRYYGEPVAAVIAKSKENAEKAVQKIKVKYKKLNSVSSSRKSLKKEAPILHKNLKDYTHIPDVLPQPNSNIANLNNLPVTMLLWKTDLLLLKLKQMVMYKFILLLKLPLLSKNCLLLILIFQLGRSML